MDVVLVFQDGVHVLQGKVNSDRCGKMNNNVYVCKSGYCCSKYGWCGNKEAHCGAEYQSPFGKCWQINLNKI